MTTAPPPGWYPDPAAHGTQRYWDGTAWTESVSPMPGYVPPAPPPGAPAVYAPSPPGHARASYAPAAQVSFVEAVKLGFGKFGTFAGRATRAEYWWWYLFTILVFVPLYVILLVVTVAVAGTASTSTSADGTTTVGTASAGGGAAALVVSLIMVVIALALVVPSISVMVRRLHDTGRSGWWYWISLIPFGGIVLLVFLVGESNPGPNQFGPPSRGAADLS